MHLNHYLLGFAIGSLRRSASKSLFSFIVFTLLIFLLASILLIAGSIKHELELTVDALPQIIVQRIQAGRQDTLNTERLKELNNIQGVEAASPRVWGYYYFEKAGVNFSVLGIDPFERQYKDSFEKILDKKIIEDFYNGKGMIVGEGVQKVLKENYYGEYFNFIKPDGSLIKVPIIQTFSGMTSLESNDIVLLPRDKVREIFGYENDEATDIVIHVANPEEIPTIATKIRMLYPDSRVITQNDLRVSYQNIFDYKSGLFLSLFVIAAFTFFMLIYDRASGLDSTQKREIGILKALGWQTKEILYEKFYEAFILSFVAFIVALILALFFVYTLQAPLLRDIFMGYARLKPAFDLPFYLDTATLFLLFMLSVPLYIASIIVPSWKAATSDADEVMR